VATQDLRGERRGPLQIGAYLGSPATNLDDWGPVFANTGNALRQSPVRWLRGRNPCRREQVRHPRASLARPRLAQRLREHRRPGGQSRCGDCAKAPWNTRTRT